MRVLFALLALTGLAGIAFGVLTIIGGALLAAVSLYLLFTWGRKESSSGTVHHV